MLQIGCLYDSLLFVILPYPKMSGDLVGLSHSHPIPLCHERDWKLPAETLKAPVRVI